MYLAPDMRPSRSESTLHLLAQADPDYKLVMVGDAYMAPTELLAPGGAIDYECMNQRSQGRSGWSEWRSTAHAPCGSTRTPSTGSRASTGRTR